MADIFSLSLKLVCHVFHGVLFSMSSPITEMFPSVPLLNTSQVGRHFLLGFYDFLSSI
jgi:hypothetical protein